MCCHKWQSWLTFWWTIETMISLQFAWEMYKVLFCLPDCFKMFPPLLHQLCIKLAYPKCVEIVIRLNREEGMIRNVKNGLQMEKLAVDPLLCFCEECWIKASVCYLGLRETHSIYLWVNGLMGTIDGLLLGRSRVFAKIGTQMKW